MYEKIVVPLDGSKLAECVLPYVEELAKGCDTKEVVLVSVTERVIGRTRAPETQEVYQASGETRIGLSGSEEARIGISDSEVILTLGKKEKQALRYLGRIAKRLQKKGIKVRTEVLLGNTAEEIARFVEHGGANLIVMASHGRSGPTRWAYGSVADKVFRASCVPILMVRAPGCFTGI